MGEFMEGLMAVMGIMAGMMVAITALLDGNAPRSGQGDESRHAPRTIRPQQGRMAA